MYLSHTRPRPSLEMTSACISQLKAQGATAGLTAAALLEDDELMQQSATGSGPDCRGHQHADEAEEQHAKVQVALVEAVGMPRCAEEERARHQGIQDDMEESEYVDEAADRRRRASA